MLVKKRVKILRKMLSLYDEYICSPQVTISSQQNNPTEFIKNKICEKNLFLPENDEIIMIFYDFCTVRPLLQNICEEKIWPNTDDGLLFLYTTLFLSDQKNQFEIFTMLSRTFKARSRKKIFNFLIRPDFPVFIAEKLQQITLNLINDGGNINQYESNKIKDKILKEISSKAELFKKYIDPKLDQKIHEVNKDNQIKIKDKVSEDGIQYIIEGTKFPKFSYSEECMANIDIDKSLKSIPNINGSQTSNLTPVSSKLQIETSNSTIMDLKKISEISQNIKTTSTNCSNQNRLANSSTVPVVRTTIAQILREGADIRKKAIKNEKLLQNLCKGSFDPNSVTNLLTQIKESEEETELFEIERKHLLGKISLEEAKIARLNAKIKNKEKALELKEHQKLLDIKLSKIREIEEEKLRNAIEKSHSIVIAMRNSQQKNLEAKKQNAKTVQQNSKALEELKIQRQKEDLDRKIQIIRQIKELEQASENHFQTMFGKSYELNLRTSCNMSIEELKKALTQMKANISKEISERREKILKDKSKQEEMLQNTQLKIAKYRKLQGESLKEKKPKKPVELKQYPELLLLKNKLETKKRELAKIERNSNAVLI